MEGQSLGFLECTCQMQALWSLFRGTFIRTTWTGIHGWSRESEAYSREWPRALAQGEAWLCSFLCELEKLLNLCKSQLPHLKNDVASSPGC